MSNTIHAWKAGASHLSSGFADKKLDFGDFLCPNLKNIEEFKADYFTSRDYWKISTCPERTLGRYQLGSATAELTQGHTGGKSLELDYWLKMRFEKFKDGQELYTLIRSGKILPVVSYQEKQMNTPVRQFRDLIREFIRLTQVHIRSKFASQS